MFKRTIALALAAVLCLSLSITGISVRAQEENSPEKPAAAAGTGETNPNTDPSQAPAVKPLLQRMLECETTGGMKKLYTENEAAVKALEKADLNKIITRYNVLAEKEGLEKVALLELPPVTPKDGAKDGAKDNAPKDDVKDEAPKDDVNKDDANKDEANKDDVNKDDVNKDDANKDEANKDDANKDDANKDDVNKDDANKDEANKDDANKDDANKDEANKDEAANNEAAAPAEPSPEAVALFEQFMACETYEAMVTLRDSLTPEQIALLTEEQIDAIDEKAMSLEPEIPETPDEPAAPAEPEEPAEDSVVHVPAKNVTNVAKPIVYEPQEPEFYQPPVMSTFAMPFGMPTTLEEPNPSDPGDGIFTYKKAEPNGDGTYTVTLESYATGSSIITEVTEDKPTDIVLVLDQSGSMDWDLTGQGYHRYSGTERQNQKLYEKRHNSSSWFSEPNLYHKLEDGSYVEVSVRREGTSTGAYRALSKNTPNAGFLFGSGYWTYRDSLYAKVDGEYQKVTVSSSGSWGSTKYTYKIGKKTIATSTGSSSIPTFTGVDDGCLYVYEESHLENTYTYYYTQSRKEIVIGTSVGDNTEFGNNDGNPSLYYHAQDMKRVAALQSALRNFNNTVYARAIGPDGQPGTDDDVNHRIAMMGYGSEGTRGNTELFYVDSQGQVKTDDYGDGIKNSSYKAAFQDMNSAAGKAAVDSMVDSLEAEGATRSDLGMTMAQNVLSKNPVDDNRTRVVILFTDGAPTTSSDFSLQVANTTINIADAIKGTDVTVYTVGIFDGADATSAGKKPSGNLSESSHNFIAACNWYMQRTSSNNGTVQDPSYYMSANNAAALDNIFGQIASHIEQGGSHTKLNEKAVIRDVVTPYFVMKPGTPVTLETYKCIGLDASSGYIWEKNPDAMGAAVTTSTVNDDQNNLKLDQLSVTGFDFSENYVGTVTEDGKVSYRGNKLVISFVVQPREGFLGGNQVPTNVRAGVFENKKAQLPLKEFPIPTVDVKIKKVTVNTPDSYVYLNGIPDADKLSAKVTASCGTVPLNPAASDTMGLQPWQTDYVTLTADHTIPTEALTQTGSYDYTVTVAPLYSGSNKKPVSGTGSGELRVMTPTVTWQDSQLNGGATPDYEAENYVSTEWGWWNGRKNVVPDENDIVDTRGAAAPALSFEYAPAAKAVTKDTPVAVTVKLGDAVINENTAFKHLDCSFSGCNWGEAKAQGYHFIVHVKTFKLVITKNTPNGVNDANDTFIFTVSNGSDVNLTVSLMGGQSVTIQNLPAGSYTVTENTAWSTGYTADGPTVIRITPDSIADGVATASFTNIRQDVPLMGSAAKNNHWLVPVK